MDNEDIAQQAEVEAVQAEPAQAAPAPAPAEEDAVAVDAAAPLQPAAAEEAQVKEEPVEGAADGAAPAPVEEAAQAEAPAADAGAAEPDVKPDPEVKPEGEEQPEAAADAEPANGGARKHVWGPPVKDPQAEVTKRKRKSRCGGGTHGRDACHVSTARPPGGAWATLQPPSPGSQGHARHAALCPTLQQHSSLLPEPVAAHGTQRLAHTPRAPADASPAAAGGQRRTTGPPAMPWCPSVAAS
jgi:hypothetical protein